MPVLEFEEYKFMDGFHFREIQYLYLLITLLPLGWLFYFLIERRKRAFINLMGEIANPRATRLVTYYRFRASLILTAIFLAIIALARPQWGMTKQLIETRGTDVIIAVDVSLSMLATDEAPSRLARARRMCVDLMDSLQENRIGIIAFAGNNVGLMPLTLDKGALETFIDSLDVQLASTNSSTSIEQAISQATQSLKTSERSSKALILISDGEEQKDNPETAVRQAAQEAATNGILIVTVGVGSPQGSKIPLDVIGKAGFKLDQDGKEVVTKLQENLLQTAAEVTSGIYLHAQPNASEIKEIRSFVNKLSTGEIRSLALEEREERFQYFLALVVLFIVIDLVLSPYLSKHL